MDGVGIRSIPIPQVRWGKRKQRSQMCELNTDDGRILLVEFDVLRGCIDDDVKELAFLLSTDNQYLGDDGQWYQILGEQSTKPICPLVPDDTNLNNQIENIFRESHEGAKINCYRLARKKQFMDRLLWLITIPAVTLLIVYALEYLGR